MFKAKAASEVKVGERVYQFICDSDAQLVEVIDVLNIVLKNVQKLLDEVNKKSEEVPESPKE